MHVAREAQAAGTCGVLTTGGGDLDLEARLGLLEIATSGRQELTAHPAPPTGLVFVDSGVICDASDTPRESK